MVFVGFLKIENPFKLAIIMGLLFEGLPIFGLFSKDPVSENFLQMSITVDFGIFTILLVFVKGHFALSPQGLYWRLFPILLLIFQWI